MTHLINKITETLQSVNAHDYNYRQIIAYRQSKEDTRTTRQELQDLQTLVERTRNAAVSINALNEHYEKALIKAIENYQE